MRTLIENATILTMTETGIIDSGYIVVEDDRIADIQVGICSASSFDERIDGSNFIIMPGMINTHTHAAMTFLRGYADDLPLMEWLHNKIIPREDKLTPEYIYWGTKLAIIEMVKSGTTCFNDMYFFMKQVAEAVLESGVRAVLARGITQFSPNGALEECRTFFNTYHQAGNGRIKTWIAPHAAYTCPPELLQQCISLAAELKTGLHIHVSETLSEQQEIMDKYGKSPVAHLASLGLFTVPTIAAHGVHLSDDDISILAEHHVSVAHNPESNMKLASGIAPVTKLLAAGVNVSLGTDGASSNNDLSLLLEMRSAALLQKVHTMDATALPAYVALEMATTRGAKALAWQQEIGKLQPGYKADLIMIRTTSPNMTPLYNPISNLVYAADNEDVDSVMVDGKWLLRGRTFLPYSEQETINQVQRLVKDLG